MALSDYDFKKIFLFFGSLFLFILAVAGVVSSIYFYNKYKTTEKRVREAAVVSQEDVQALVARVGKLIKLPEGELPTVATVTDLDKLKSQSFFAKAKIGDRVLLYTEAKKAFLYDPVENVIVEVGPLIIPTATPALTQVSPTAALSQNNQSQVIGAATVSGQIKKPLKTALYNGTTTASTLTSFEEKLTSQIKDITVSLKTNAKQRDYAKTVVIDLTGQLRDTTQIISQTLNIEVSALPSQESAPDNADLLIILGSDQL